MPPREPRPATSAPHNEPAFAAPWEAEAFALRTHLVERGIIDATAFSEALSEALAQTPEAADGGTFYYVAFVTALERTLSPIAPPAALSAEVEAWHQAAAATPHGTPITLPPQKTPQ